MAETVREEDVLFRVTRPNTTVFHPDRSIRLLPVQTGGEISLPKSVAEYHVRNGVGEIVTGKESPETPEIPETPKVEEPKAPARRPGRPAKSPE